MIIDTDFLRWLMEQCPDTETNSIAVDAIGLIEGVHIMAVGTKSAAALHDAYKAEKASR